MHINVDIIIPLSYTLKRHFIWIVLATNFHRDNPTAKRVIVLVEWLGQTADDREVLGSILTRV